MGEYREREDVRREPGIDNPVGIDQGANAGIATEQGIEHGDPPRLAGYQSSPRSIDETEYPADEDLPPGTRTGDEPPGHR